MTEKEAAPAAKKLKMALHTSDTPMEEAPTSTSLAIVPATKTQEGGSSSAPKANSLIPKALERLTLTVNPSYLTRLKQANELGYERPFSQRRLTKRHYEINIVNFRLAMTNILQNYLQWKLLEQGRFTDAQVVAEIKEIVPICVDACMTALYSKLRTLHKQFGTYAQRFTTPATYARDIELPLPLADAIQQFGSFETRCMTKNFIMVPVYPEGTKHEGRKVEDWNADKYESCMPILRDCGVPLKNVDTRVKAGTAWWTYKIEKIESAFDFRCILPPLHYSEHSAILASMFLIIDEEKELLPIIKHLIDDVEYGVRLREVRLGFQMRAFSALCHAPSEEWNSFTSID